MLSLKDETGRRARKSLTKLRTSRQNFPRGRRMKLIPIAAFLIGLADFISGMDGLQQEWILLGSFSLVMWFSAGMAFSVEGWPDKIGSCFNIFALALSLLFAVSWEWQSPAHFTESIHALLPPSLILLGACLHRPTRPRTQALPTGRARETRAKAPRAALTPSSDRTSRKVSGAG
ncbi:hypothetical protein [Austwickia chelonae]|uniref:Uncharacterized protein n=1 Tax=Austwickia chelonae NBRC 105200 TaxID=1184607 RepID=K6VLG5_9MICO|nr:hypothetical protein [Austwickia chelonae]GAB77549.1 hypothetical protein AUCHE_05_04610 [Austwickia chelonae NBRC 105200]